jgi:CheY-like chemotaxis protein
MTGDPARLQQIVSNLLSIAVKFTPPGGWVEARVRGRGSQLEVCVEDNGRGIEPELLPLIFERFRQGDASTTREEGGLGLGLAIVRHLVELHGGVVEAESPGPGAGSKFTVRFPVPAIRPEAREVVRSGLASHGEGLAPRALEGVVVLVVDDQQDAREAIAAVLASRGARVVSAESASAALRAIAREPVDVLVSDIAMPESDGFSLIAELRGAGRQLPALALTAHAGPEERRRILAAGYDWHLPKPVEAADLLFAVAQLSKRS